MKIRNRQQMLGIVAITAVTLFAGDKIIIEPLTSTWQARSKKIAELRKQVEEGSRLARRSQSLQSHWDQMRTNTLPTTPSFAEHQVLNAFDRWSQESHISVTSISPQWKHDSDDFMTLECRMEGAGNIATISRFLYDLERDPMALKLENVEISSRDSDGQQLALGLQVSGLVLNGEQR
jgi:hypothetical protein